MRAWITDHLDIRITRKVMFTSVCVILSTGRGHGLVHLEPWIVDLTRTINCWLVPPIPGWSRIIIGTGGAVCCYWLPPASEGWGRYYFHRCLSVHRSGTPVPGSFPGLWSLVLSQGVPRSQVLSLVPGPPWSFPGGTPIPAVGGTPEMIGYPLAGTGVPQLRLG